MDDDFGGFEAADPNTQINAPQTNVPPTWLVETVTPKSDQIDKEKSRISVVDEHARDDNQQIKYGNQNTSDIYQRLEEKLLKTETNLREQEQKLQQIQQQHKKDLEELQDGSKKALTIIVQEYQVNEQILMIEDITKESIKVAVLGERQQNEQIFKRLLQDYISNNELKQTTTADSINTKVERMEFELKSTFNDHLSKCKQELQDFVESRVAESQEQLMRHYTSLIEDLELSLKKMIMTTIDDERKTTKNALLNEKNSSVEFTTELKDSTDKHIRQLFDLQKESIQLQIKDQYQYERTKLLETMNETLTDIKKRFNDVFDEQKQRDQLCLRKHLTCLQLFLHSAKEQLTIINDQMLKTDTDEILLNL